MDEGEREAAVPAGEVECLEVAGADLEAALGRTPRRRVGHLDAREAPSGRPEAAEDVEEAAVSAADVDDGGRVVAHEPPIAPHLGAFDAVADELQQRALDLLLAIRVVVAGIDDAHRSGAGARRDEHEPTTGATAETEEIGHR